MEAKASRFVNDGAGTEPASKILSRTWAAGQGKITTLADSTTANPTARKIVYGNCAQLIDQRDDKKVQGKGY